MALKRPKNPVRQITEITISTLPPRTCIVRYAAGQTSFPFLRQQLDNANIPVDEHEAQPPPKEPTQSGP